MNQSQFQLLLQDLEVGKVSFLDTTTSTNNIAAKWIQEGVDDFSIVAADTQTHGRGRDGRTWHTLPGSALAFSIVLKPHLESAQFSRYSALGAIAVCKAFQDGYAINAQIKWPNDVLIRNQKVAGVLTEIIWKGNIPQGVIIGIGVNIHPGSLPPDANLNFPASYLEAFTELPVDRFTALRQILLHIKEWRRQINSERFIRQWNGLLAFKGEKIQLLQSTSEIQTKSLTGTLTGIDENGMLMLKLANGNHQRFTANEIRIIKRE